MIIFGEDSSPTSRQIAEEIIKYGGTCTDVLRWCTPRSSYSSSDRDGQSCPLWAHNRTCPFTREQRVLAFRKWLMESLDG